MSVSSIPKRMAYWAAVVFPLVSWRGLFIPFILSIHVKYSSCHCFTRQMSPWLMAPFVGS